jgi:carbon storage regulator
MLVLSRQQNESIRVGEEIKITTVEITGATVRVGIDCPLAMPIRKDTKEAQPIARKDAGQVVISRERERMIFIGDDVVVTIIDINSACYKMRYGIECPKELHVCRQEMYDAVKQQEAEAAQAKAEEQARPADEAGKRITRFYKRTEKQALVIKGNIIVTVHTIEDGTVRLEVETSKRTWCSYKEVYDRKQARKMAKKVREEVRLAAEKGKAQWKR